ncbi:MAG: peptide chain release factor N(5)-glutamine methyltransferase [Candidatus Latescibacteria bacterium]|nr:peptide chain release factor N(5)-glutamine methyltransferase [Candidatus Latescibacterota bacterium]
MRVIEIINIASEHLSEKGYENPRLEVERMLGSVLGLSRLDLYMAFDRPLTENELERFRSMYRRRLAHEPLQHIIGSTGFRDLEIKTDHRALIPRPETELLVDLAVTFLRERSNAFVADLGTGSGIIALSILYEVPESKAVAIDISGEALNLAKQNACQLGVENRIQFLNGDMLESLDNLGPFDAILSNPPYVRSGEIETLEPEVRSFEPRMALDGGPDGLQFIVPIVQNSHRFLKPGGLLLLECGDYHAESILKKITETGCYSNSEIITDLAGKKRIVKALC